jgi:hypothetical protein
MAAGGWERAESFHKNNIIIFVSRSSGCIPLFLSASSFCWQKKMANEIGVGER